MMNLKRTIMLFPYNEDTNSKFPQFFGFYFIEKSLCFIENLMKNGTEK